MNEHDVSMNHHARLIRHASYAQYIHPESEFAVTRLVSEKFGIDEARALTAQAQLRPATSAGQVFVVQTGFVTHEAQNALLKLFEEPPQDTRFVLVVPPALQLLPTLLSRIGSDEQQQNQEVDTTVWDAFVAATIPDRLLQIDSWQKSKDASWLQSITAGVHAIDTATMNIQQREVVRLVGSTLQTRGASNKMLLEHMALTLPLRE